MVRSWVLEGELEDTFGEFFMVVQPVTVDLLRREGYKLHPRMLPSFISPSLAQRILRTGKSTRGGLGRGETDALEHLVSEAAKRIDKRLLDVLYTRCKFKEHCLAIKHYLLLGQYLMDIVEPKLSEPANNISSFELAGFLEAAIWASNAQYDDRDMLDRLRVKMMPHGSGDRGWDVFSLEYEARVPLDTVFT